LIFFSIRPQSLYLCGFYGISCKNEKPESTGLEYVTPSFTSKAKKGRLTFRSIFATTGGMKTTQKQPAATVSLKNISIPIFERTDIKNGVTYRGFFFTFTEQGKRKQKRCNTIEAAKAEALKVIRDQTDHQPHNREISLSEFADFSSAMQMLRKHPGSTLTKAIAEWAQAQETIGSGSIVTACAEYRKNLERQSGFTPALLSNVVKDFYKHLESADASPRYRQDCKSRMGRAASTFRGNIHAITTQDLGAWLDGLKIAPRTRKNMRTAMVTLFAFAKQQGHLPRDRQTEAELIPARQKMNATKRTAPIGIYTATELTKILAAPGGLLPVLAIAAFAGVRAAELHRLTWDDIKANHIVVAEEKSKTASRRIVPIVPALAVWLKRVERGDKDDRLCKHLSHESAFSRAVNAAVRAAGVTPVHNGFRHSFCTYRLASIQNTAQVALEAGNSPTMLFKHYRELATKKQATAWFAVRPPTKGGKILEFAAA
jgi:integrase